MPTDAQRRQQASAHHAEVQALTERIALLEQKLAEESQKIFPGDYFTHDRLGKRFVCRAVVRNDYDGMNSLVRVEIEPAITRTQEQT